MTLCLFLLATAGMGCCALIRHRRQRRMQQSERRYRRLVEGVHTSVATIAADGHIRSANRALLQMLGLSPAQPIDVLTFPPTEALQRLAGGIAHDLNNHLTVIHAYADLLALDEDIGDNPDLAAIRRAAHEIGHLAGQLLTFSRERPDQPPVVLDLNRLIDDSRDILQCLAGREVRIETRLTPDLCPVEAVPGQIAQALIGLATYAPGTTPCNRTLTFETAQAPEGVALSVTDTGLDLDEDSRVHLFEPFAGVPRGCKVGLGLAVAHGIVTRHGGRIEVSSHPGRGTTFTIHLPARKGSIDGTTHSAR